MKEIGKLLELLNEYREKELGYRVPEWEEKGQLGIITEQLISKKFGFIGWLVDNDKIDTNKLEKIGYEKTVYEVYGQHREIVEYSDYEGLLMLLAISDMPIEDLISYLK